MQKLLSCLSALIIGTGTIVPILNNNMIQEGINKLTVKDNGNYQLPQPSWIGDLHDPSNFLKLLIFNSFIDPMKYPNVASIDIGDDVKNFKTKNSSAEFTENSSTPLESQRVAHEEATFVNTGDIEITGNTLSYSKTLTETHSVTNSESIDVSAGLSFKIASVSFNFDYTHSETATTETSVTLTAPPQQIPVPPHQTGYVDYDIYDQKSDVRGAVFTEIDYSQLIWCDVKFNDGEPDAVGNYYLVSMMQRPQIVNFLATTAVQEKYLFSINPNDHTMVYINIPVQALIDGSNLVVTYRWTKE